MANIYYLTKAFLSGDSLRGTKKSNGKFKIPNSLTRLLMSLLFIPFGFLIFQLTESITRTLLPLDQEQLIISMGLIGTTLFIFIISLLTTPAQLFFSSDIERVLPLPVKPFEIIVARLITALIVQFTLSLFLLFSIYLGYIAVIGFDIVFLIKYIFIIILIPIFPVLVTTIIAILIIQFTGFLKNQDQYNKFVMIVSVLFLITYYYFLGTNNIGTYNMVNLFIQGGNSFVSIFTNILPHFKFAIEFLFNNNIISLLILIAITAFFVFITYIVASKYYLNCALKVNNFKAEKKVLSTHDLKERTKVKSIYFNTASRDLKELTRSPIFMMNCLATPIFLSGAIIFVSVMPVFSNDSFQLSQITGIISSTFNSVEAFLFIIVLIPAIGLFSSFGMSSSCTAISREGSQFAIIKSYPVPIEKQILGKTFPNLLVISIIVVILSIIGSVLFYFVYHDIVISVALAIISIILGEIVILFSSLFTIGIDALKPKLHWTTEQEAVKQNYFVLISLALGFLFIGGIFAFLFMAPLDIAIKSLIIVSIYLLSLPLSWLFYKFSLNRLCKFDI